MIKNIIKNIKDYFRCVWGCFVIGWEDLLE